MSASDRSSLFSIDGLADMVYSLPESVPEREEDHGEEGVFDIDILLRKLQAYKDSLEEAAPSPPRPKRPSPCEPKDVIVAPSFRHDIAESTGISGGAGNPRGLPALSSSSSTSSEGRLDSPQTPDGRAVLQALKEASEQFREDSSLRKRSRSFKGQGVVYGNVKAQRGALTLDSPRPLASPAFAPLERLQQLSMTTSRSATESPLISPTNPPTLSRGPPANIALHVQAHGIQQPRPSPIWQPSDSQCRGELEQFALRRGNWTERTRGLDSGIVVETDDDDGSKNAAQEKEHQQMTAEEAASSARKSKAQREKPMSFRDKMASFVFLRRRTKSENIIDMYLRF